MTHKTRKHSNKYRKKNTSRNIKTYRRRHKRSYGIRSSSSKHRKSHYRGGGFFDFLRFGSKTPEPNKQNASTPTDSEPAKLATAPEQPTTAPEQPATATAQIAPAPSQIAPAPEQPAKPSTTWPGWGGSRAKRRSSSRYRTK